MSRILQHPLRAEYEQFREDISRDLDPIEVEFGGIPTFKEWLAERESHARDDSHATDFQEVSHYA